MNSRQRTQTTFAHREPDRVPVFELDINSPPATDIMGREMMVGIGGYVYGPVRARYFSDGNRGRLRFIRRTFEDAIALYDELDLDIFKFPNIPPAEIPEETAPNQWRYTEPESGQWREILYAPESDMWGEIDSSIRRQGLEGLRRYVDHLEQHPPRLEGAVLQVIDDALSPIRDRRFLMGDACSEFPADASWLPVFLEAMVVEPELVERYFAVQTKAGLHRIEKQAQLGVDAIVGGDDIAYSHSTFFSPAMFERYYQPCLRRLAERCHELGLPYVKHTDGNIKPVEAALLTESGLDGYHAIDPRAGMDLGEIKQKYGDRLTLLGNVDCAHSLVSGRPDQVRAEVQTCIRQAGPGGGYVLSSSNSIHSGVPAVNFLAMLEAAREYGRYPIEV